MDNYAQLRRLLEIDSPFVANSVEAIEYSNALGMGSYFWDKPRYSFDYQASGQTFTTQDIVKQMLLDREKSSMWWQRFIIYNENGDPLTRYVIRPILSTENSGDSFNPVDRVAVPLNYDGNIKGPLDDLGSNMTSSTVALRYDDPGRVAGAIFTEIQTCLLYTSPSPRDS